MYARHLFNSHNYDPDLRTEIYLREDRVGVRAADLLLLLQTDSTDDIAYTEMIPGRFAFYDFVPLRRNYSLTLGPRISSRFPPSRATLAITLTRCRWNSRDAFFEGMLAAKRIYRDPERITARANLRNGNVVLEFSYYTLRDIALSEICVIRFVLSFRHSTLRESTIDLTNF